MPRKKVGNTDKPLPIFKSDDEILIFPTTPNFDDAVPTFWECALCIIKMRNQYIKERPPLNVPLYTLHKNIIKLVTFSSSYILVSTRS
jgi:hypothetical protein